MEKAAEGRKEAAEGRKEAAERQKRRDYKKDHKRVDYNDGTYHAGFEN